MTRLTTNNLIETTYLLDRYHRIVNVSLTKGVYGVEELAVTLEGENIELDHGSFLLHGKVDLTRLSETFKAVMDRIWIKGEERTL